MDKNEILNSDWYVRKNAAGNPNIPADVLTEIKDYLIELDRDACLKLFEEYTSLNRDKY